MSGAQNSHTRTGYYPPPPPRGGPDGYDATTQRDRPPSAPDPVRRRRITDARVRVFTRAVEQFRAGVGLRRVHPFHYPLRLAQFGAGVHRRYPPEPAVPALDHMWLDHPVFAGVGSRLAVAMAWPYQSAERLRAVLAEVVPGDGRFVVGVDGSTGDPAREPDRRGVASVYGGSGATGWIIADGSTVGAERAAEVVAAFLAGGHGLADAAAAQAELDEEQARLWEAAR